MKHTHTHIYIGSISADEYYRLLTAQLLLYSSHEPCNMTFSHFFFFPASRITTIHSFRYFVSRRVFATASKVKLLSCHRKSDTYYRSKQDSVRRAKSRGLITRDTWKFPLSAGTHSKLTRERKNGGSFRSFNGDRVRGNALSKLGNSLTFDRSG